MLCFISNLEPMKRIWSSTSSYILVWLYRTHNYIFLCNYTPLTFHLNRSSKFMTFYPKIYTFKYLDEQELWNEQENIHGIWEALASQSYIVSMTENLTWIGTGWTILSLFYLSPMRGQPPPPPPPDYSMYTVLTHILFYYCLCSCIE